MRGKWLVLLMKEVNIIILIVLFITLNTTIVLVNISLNTSNIVAWLIIYCLRLKYATLHAQVEGPDTGHKTARRVTKNKCLQN